MGMQAQVQPRAAVRRLRKLSPRQELTAILLLGAVGAGLVFLAMKQDWAQVHTVLPRPLPDSRVNVSGAALVPAADALVVAGLATLAAVLATRWWLRRLTGVLLAVIGAALAVAAFTISAAAAVSAVRTSVSPESAGAGSVMDGAGTAGQTGPDVAGTPTHVLFTAGAWQSLVVAGAIAMVAAGLLVTLRANRLAVMSSRYDSPAAAAGRVSVRSGAARAPAGAADAGASAVSHASKAGEAAPADSAGIWDALSRGDDPTAPAGSGAGLTQQ